MTEPSEPGGRRDPQAFGRAPDEPPSWQPSAATHAETLIAWVCSLAVGLLLVGPLLSTGALFQLDRSLIADAPLPTGTFGLGPEIPRDVPLSSLLWLLGSVFDHITIGKALMVLSVAGAGAGMFRLSRRFTGNFCAACAAILYATSPYLLTRLFVGHQAMWVAAAVLPWVLPALTDRRRPFADVFLACVALGLAGSYGGIVAWLVVLSATNWTGPLRRSVRRLLAALAASVFWLLPGIIVVYSGTSIVSSSRFPAGTDSIGEIFALFAGQGFWLPTYEVGIQNSLIVAVLGLTLLILAVLGSRRLPTAGRRSLEILAAGSIVLSAAPGAPILAPLVDMLTSTPVGAPFREPQRFLLLYVCWMALAAPVGAQRLARRWRRAREVLVLLPLACALVLSSHGWWGLDDSLRPTSIPEGWTEARAIIREGGGTTLALPWARYLSLRFAESPRSINPLPKFLGTDVLLSSDLGIGGDSKERSESREDAADEIVRGLLQLDTESIDDELRNLGVRWIVVIHEGSYERFLPGLSRLDLEPVLIRPDIELFEVPGWGGEAVTQDGDIVAVPRVGLPLASVEDERAFTWYRSYQAGWLRGLRPMDREGPGLLGVPGGAGPIWFWPTTILLVADVAVISASLCFTIRSFRRRRDRLSP